METNPPGGELIKEVLIRPGVKIVNNSWGDTESYLDALFEAEDDPERADFWGELRKIISKYTADIFLENLAEQDKLMVFLPPETPGTGGLQFRPRSPALYRA